MRSKILIIVAFISASCASLVQEIDPQKIPNTEAKLVIGCFINPSDTLIRLRVLTTIPVFGSNQIENTSGGVGQVKVGKDTLYIPTAEEIIDAEATLTSSGKTVPFTYLKKEGVYGIKKSVMPIIEGQSYTLNVKAKDGRTIKASCTVPAKIVPTSYKIDTTISRGILFSDGQTTDVQGFAKTVDVKWVDPAGQTNYYEIAGFYTYKTTFTDRSQKSRDTTATVPFNFNNQGGRGALMDDVNSNGKEITAVNGLFIPVGVLGLNQRQTIIDAKTVVTAASFALSHVDQHYLKYRRSIYAARSNNFFTEPTLVYSNIEGGYGCFGAYNTTFVAFYKSK